MDHRKTTPAITASMAQLVRHPPLGLTSIALERFRLWPVLRVSTHVIGNRAGKLHSRRQAIIAALDGKQ
jgi:hypothetical protein